MEGAQKTITTPKKEVTHTFYAQPLFIIFSQMNMVQPLLLQRLRYQPYKPFHIVTTVCTVLLLI